ncbi:MAG: GNAT family N-acetyltransferase [Nocardioidaceae bacterium]
MRTAAVFAPEARDESQQEPGDSGNCSPVGGGSYSPVDDVAELVGVAVLPAYRRRGLAAQVTHLLAMDAMARGVTTVFCSAQSEDVARVYEGIGFHRVGTACIASAP